MNITSSYIEKQFPTSQRLSIKTFLEASPQPPAPSPQLPFFSTREQASYSTFSQGCCTLSITGPLQFFPFSSFSSYSSYLAKVFLCLNLCDLFSRLILMCLGSQCIILLRDVTRRSLFVTCFQKFWQKCG